MSRHLRHLDVTTDSLHELHACGHDCLWWPAPAARAAWAARLPEGFAPFGKAYRSAEDGRVVGSLLYAPPRSIRPASALPGGPPSRDAALLACSWLDPDEPRWVLQSLLLQVLAELRERGLPALEAFGYHYPSSASEAERFHGHQSLLCAEWLEATGFVGVRTLVGRLELMRVELAALRPLREPVDVLQPFRRLARRLVPSPGGLPIPAGASPLETVAQIRRARRGGRARPGPRPAAPR